MFEEFKQKFPALFEKLDYMNLPEGWKDLVNDLCMDIIKCETLYQIPQYEPVVFSQVKEKYGGLRVYYEGGFINDEPVYPILYTIRKYENMSLKTCSICGTKDNSKLQAIRGWILTCCADCFQTKSTLKPHR
jgi:hypothetical protein